MMMHHYIFDMEDYRRIQIPRFSENSEHAQSVCIRLSFYFSHESLGTRLRDEVVARTAMMVM